MVFGMVADAVMGNSSGRIEPRRRSRGAAPIGGSENTVYRLHTQSWCLAQGDSVSLPQGSDGFGAALTVDPGAQQFDRGQDQGRDEDQQRRHRQYGRADLLAD